MSKQRVYRALARLEEAVSKDLGGGKWEYKGKTGVWRTTGKAHDRVFIPDDGSGPMGAHPEVAKRMSSGSKKKQRQMSVAKAVLGGSDAKAAKESLGKLERAASDFAWEIQKKFGKKSGRGGIAEMLSDYAVELSNTASTVSELEPDDFEGNDPDAVWREVRDNVASLEQSMKGVMGGMLKLDKAGHRPFESIKGWKEVSKSYSDARDKVEMLGLQVSTAISKSHGRRVG